MLNQQKKLMLTLFVLLFITGCASTITSVPYKENSGKEEIDGVPYVLPKGLVPIQVFADSNGIGVTIEPARSVIDYESGKLVARLRTSPFSKEDIKVAADPATGFLKTITSNSETQVLAILEEGAKSAARLALQSGRATSLAQKVVVMNDTFDPLSSTDVTRINNGVNAAIQRAAHAFRSASGRSLSTKKVVLTVLRVDGTSFPTKRAVVDTSRCIVGICVRTRTSLRVELEIDEKPFALFASKIINIPSREVVAVPIPSTILADQDIAVTITNGILEKYDIKRDSELLTVAKIPGAIVSGIVTGLTEGFAAEKSIIDAQKNVASSEEALAEARKSRNEAVESLDEVSVDLQNTPDSISSKTSYEAQTLTVYPFSETLTNAIRQVMNPKNNEPQVTNSNRPGEEELVD